jgi:hypothetical protein
MFGRVQQMSMMQLNTEARAGDRDACLQLANRAGNCDTLEQFMRRFVPSTEWARCFDVYCDAFERSRSCALLDTLELPAVEHTQTGLP